MKNFTFTALFSAIALFSTAQEVIVDFEALSLPGAESFYNGADAAGAFTTQGATFSNTYTAEGGYWNGFSYSNTTDVITVDYDNQYSAYAGSGANGSANYGVFYPAGIITFATPVEAYSMKVTNTTFTGLTMLNGDAFSKQFGSVNGPNGEPDGTEGADYLRVWIYGLDQEFQKTDDSVVFYLADYRFPENDSDYVLNTWKKVDLSPLGNIFGLGFKFESSDTGQFGINTPTYFAVDNLSYHSVLGIDENSANTFAVYPNPVKDVVNIQGGAGMLTVTDMTGKVIATRVHNGFTSMDLSDVVSGMYLVSMESNGNISRKTILK
jgi:hypothetical protein